MSKEEVVHSTFTIERTFPVPPARVFKAFADAKEKRQWFRAEELGERLESFTSDFRVGGSEKSRFRFQGNLPGAPPDGTMMGNDTVYVDIIENERIVFAYVMLVGDRRMSASLATIQLEPAGKGTRFTFTEQAAFFGTSDGPKLRKDGWTGLFESLANALSA